MSSFCGFVCCAFPSWLPSSSLLYRPITIFRVLCPQGTLGYIFSEMRLNNIEVCVFRVMRGTRRRVCNLISYNFQR